MIILMHSARSRALTATDAEILNRFGHNRRATYAAADRRDAETMYARTDATGEHDDDRADPPGADHGRPTR
jgi:hypothetical protein